MAGIYYPAVCGNLPPYDCNPCEPLELGRIRGFGFISSDYIDALLVDPSNVNLWDTGIDAGEIVVIPASHGELPEPSPKMGPGFGNTVETLIAYDFAAKVWARNFITNGTFWNQLSPQQNYYFYYSSSSQTYISTNTCTIIPSYSIPDDLTGLVNWMVTVKWQAATVPNPFPTPASVLSECFEPA